MTFLDEIEATTNDVAAQVGPAVVRIGRDGRGSGVVVEPGVVVTCAHNLRGGEATVTFPSGKRVVGTVAGADLDGDLAVVRVEADADGGANGGAVAWRDGEAAGVGAPVFALAAGGSTGPRITFGTVSSTEEAFRGPRGRRVTGSIEHTAPLPRGASGGPVVDREGRLVGINTHRLSGGFYLAQPADDSLRRRIDALAAGESPRHRRLGVAVAPPRVARKLRRSVGLPEADGLLVRQVRDGSPADAAGVAAGDLLVEGAGRPLDSVDALHDVLDELGADETLSLRVLRGAESLTVAVTFGDTTSEGTA